MARRTPRPEATQKKILIPFKEHCDQCGQSLSVANHGHRTVTTLSGMWKVTLVIGQCIQPDCLTYHRRHRPEAEGRWALPPGEFGLDVMALIGKFRFREHRSVPALHQALVARGVSIALRSVTPLMHRSEELVALRITDQERVKARLAARKDGSSWPLMECLPMSGMRCSGWCATASRDPILLARPLLSRTQGDLTALRTFVKQGLEPWKVPVTGVISDGQETIGSAVACVFPELPHQRCQFHASLGGHQTPLRGRSERQHRVEEAARRGAPD